MDAQKATTTVTRMARLLGVSRSGFYAWAAREAAGPSPAQTRREALTVKIAEFYAASQNTYGARGSWPICGRPVSGSPARRWPRRWRPRGSWGSAHASSPR